MSSSFAVHRWRFSKISNSAEFVHVSPLLIARTHLPLKCLPKKDSSESNFSTILTLKELSKILADDIQFLFGLQI